MALLSPEVFAPLSSCSTAVRVAGQLPGSNVRLLVDRSPVAEVLSEGPLVDIAVTDLPARSHVTATQIVGGEESAPSPNPVVVQNRAELGVVALEHAVAACAACIKVVGAVPSAEIIVQDSAGTEIGRSHAVTGTATIPISPSPDLNDRLSIFQQACGEDGPELSVLVDMPMVKLLRRPVIHPGSLHACTRGVPVHDLTWGAWLSFERSIGLGAGAGSTSGASGTWLMPEDLVEGETVSVVAAFPGCDREERSAPVLVGPGNRPAQPQIDEPLCEGARSITVYGLTPGAIVQLFVNGASVGTGSAAYERQRFGVADPLPAGGVVRARQRHCDWGVESNDVHVAAGPLAATVKIDDRQLVACSTRVPVLASDGESGGELAVWSDRYGPLTPRLRLRDVIHDRTDWGAVAVAPALADGDDVWVEYYPCSTDDAVASARVPVVSVARLAPPQHEYPVRRSDRWIFLSHDSTAGRRVDVVIDGALVFSGLSESIPGSLGVPMLGGLADADQVMVRAVLCGKVSEWRTIPLFPHGPGRPLTEEPVGDDVELRPTFRWHAPRSGGPFDFMRLHLNRIDADVGEVSVLDENVGSDEEFDLPAGDALWVDAEYRWDMTTVRTDVDPEAVRPRREAGSRSWPALEFSTRERSSGGGGPTPYFNLRVLSDGGAFTNVTMFDLSLSRWTNTDPAGDVVVLDIGTSSLGTIAYEMRWAPSRSAAALRGTWQFELAVNVYYEATSPQYRSGWYPLYQQTNFDTRLMSDGLASPYDAICNVTNRSPSLGPGGLDLSEILFLRI